MRKRRCVFCSSFNTKKLGFRRKSRKTSQGIKPCFYQRWFCNDCRRAFKLWNKKQSCDFSRGIKACDLYYDNESSYRSVSRRLGIAPYRLFEIINALGANCKSTIDVAK
ncbi:MAG: hypothetical protein NTZ78_10105 [Candidatus Aureabacteria bacterium]|nr:hypothetical protein [Candidatus Auribacterota bacterium]